MPRKALDVCSTVSVEPDVAIELVPVAHQEAGGPQRVGVAGRELVGGQHLDDHLVVGLVGVERLDDPVAPPPDVRLALAHFGAVAVPVAIAPHVHPVPAPALAVLRAGQQPVDDLLVGVARIRRPETRAVPRAWAAGRPGRGTRGAAARSWRPAARASARCASCSAARKRSIGCAVQSACFTVRQRRSHRLLKRPVLARIGRQRFVGRRRSGIDPSCAAWRFRASDSGLASSGIRSMSPRRSTRLINRLSPPVAAIAGPRSPPARRNET